VTDLERAFDRVRALGEGCKYTAIAPFEARAILAELERLRGIEKAARSVEKRLTRLDPDTYALPDEVYWFALNPALNGSKVTEDVDR